MATRTSSAIAAIGTSADAVSGGASPFRKANASTIEAQAQAQFVTAQSCIVTPGSTSTSVVSETVYYKLRGYNSSTNQFEVWISTDPYSSPPSAASLTDVTSIRFNC